jgi:hypothetical protein
MFPSGTEGVSSDTLARLGNPKTVLLQTRKRDSTWAPAAVNIVAKDGRAYLRTYEASGKYKRLRSFPEMRLAPSTMRGKPLGPRC